MKICKLAQTRAWQLLQEVKARNRSIRRITTNIWTSLIVKFLDYSAKDAILRQFWSQRQILYKAEPIFFDHDDSWSCKKREPRYGIQSNSQKKHENISAKSPAKLRIFTSDGEKTYSTLTHAPPALRELGIQTWVDKKEWMESKMSRYRWSTKGGRWGKDPAVLSAMDVKAFLSGDECCRVSLYVV